MKTASQIANVTEYSTGYSEGKKDALNNKPFNSAYHTLLMGDLYSGYKDGYYDNTPSYYFKDINFIVPTLSDFKNEDSVIEYLYMPLGRTMRHSFGTAYIENGIFHIESAKRNGITHWRIIN